MELGPPQLLYFPSPSDGWETGKNRAAFCPFVLFPVEGERILRGSFPLP